MGGIFFFLLGLIFGSFLGCLLYRLEKKESLFEKRSFCPFCKHPLSFFDLIPVLSYVFLKGKCRYCKKRISLFYPLIELKTGFLFFLIYKFKFFSLFSLFYYLTISSLLILIFFYDLKNLIIPDRVIYPGIFFAFLLWLFYLFKSENFIFYFLNLIFALLPSLFFLFLILISKEKWLGWGDFKLSIFMALILGSPYIFLAIFFSFFLGAIIGTGLIIFKKKSLKSEIPFGPFLVSGTFLAMFFGDEILKICQKALL